MMKKLVFTIALILLVPVLLYASDPTPTPGAETTKERLTNLTTAKGVVRVTFAWTSDATGEATVSTTNYFTGCIKRVVFAPDTVASPTDNYDITILDSDGTDVLLGNGSNRSGSNIEQFTPVSTTKIETLIEKTKLTIYVTNAGSHKKGKCILYIDTM